MVIFIVLDVWPWLYVTKDACHARSWRLIFGLFGMGNEPRRAKGKMSPLALQLLSMEWQPVLWLQDYDLLKEM